MIVVIDCNIWISLTINSQIDFIADLSDKGIVIASCKALRNEITNVLCRPKFNRFISAADINNVIELYDLVVKDHMIGKIPNIVADQNDNYLFALSAKSKAHFLITGDKLLLQVKEYQKTKVITLAHFKEILFDSV